MPFIYLYKKNIKIAIPPKVQAIELKSVPNEEELAVVYMAKKLRE